MPVGHSTQFVKIHRLDSSYPSSTGVYGQEFHCFDWQDPLWTLGHLAVVPALGLLAEGQECVAYPDTGYVASLQDPVTSCVPASATADGAAAVMADPVEAANSFVAWQPVDKAEGLEPPDVADPPAHQAAALAVVAIEEGADQNTSGVTDSPFRVSSDNAS